MRLFKNRLQAAHELAQHLGFLRDDKPVVLGLANGGVPIADVVARELDATLDVLLIEKLFAPGAAAQVVGAVDEQGRISMIQSTARWHHLTSQQMVEPARAAFHDLQRRRALLRAILPEVEVRGRTVIIVGQAVITGARMLGAVASVKDRGATKVVAAAPAGTSHATWQLHAAAGMVVIPHRPAKFKGLESFYEEFDEVTDEKMLAIIQKWVSDRPHSDQAVRTIVTKLTSTLGHPLMCEVDLPPNMKRGSGPYPAVVFAHDIDSDGRSSRNVTISSRLAKRGIIGMRLDFTGHGRSGGTPDQATEAQMLADLDVACRAVAGLTEVNPARIGVMASGTGCIAALRYAAQVPDVAALVMRGPVCGRETLAARRVKAPTLIIHAEHDTALLDTVLTIDREMGAPHELLRVADANRLFNDPISMELMVGATVDWLADHLLLASDMPPIASPAPQPISATQATTAG